MKAPKCPECGRSMMFSTYKLFVICLDCRILVRTDASKTTESRRREGKPKTN